MYARYRAWVTSLPKSAQYLYGATLTGVLIGGYFALSFGPIVGLATFALVFVAMIILSNIFGSMMAEKDEKSGQPDE